LISPRSKRAVVVTEERAGGVTRTGVSVSRDGGQTWDRGGAGLPPAGAPKFLRAAPSSPDLMLLGIDVGGGAADLLYLSTDGGSTWTLRSDLTRIRVASGLNGIEFDPSDPEVVWGHGPRGLYRSKDMGRSFESFAEFDGSPTGPLDVFHAPGEPARILVFLPEDREFQVSRDGGESWFRNASPGGVDAADHGHVSEDVVVSASGSVYRYHDPTYFFFNLDAPTPGVRQIQAHRALQVSYFGHTDRTIEHYTGPVDDGGRGTAVKIPPNVSLITGNREAERESKLTPKERRIVLRPGKERTVTYELRLPKRDLPLDVYFLMDTTDSMDSVLRAATEAAGRIANGLISEGLDVEFGLAEHRAYPDSFPPRPRCDEVDQQGPLQPCERNFVYERVLRLMDRSGDHSALEAALRELESGGGGIYDSQLGALYQAATGKGQDLFPAGAGGHDVPPGQQAVFRDKAGAGLRVIIHPTDEPFGTPESGGDRDGGVSSGGRVGPPPEIPSFEEVISAMSGKMKYVGIAIGDIKKTRTDQAKIAGGTGTLAPPGGVDCNGDGSIDIPEGKPLVCAFGRRQVEQADNIAEAVIGLLTALPNKVPVSLSVEEGAPVVKGVEPELYPAVSLQSGRRLTFDVTYRCSRAQAGKRFDVQMSAATDEPLDLGVSARVVCKELRIGDEIVPPAAILAAPLVGLGVPPPPPPPPPATQLSTASQMQAQAQGQAQGAGAHQEEEQVQMAFVTAFDEAANQELAMSRYHGRRGTMPAGVTLSVGVVALGLMASVGTALSRRQKVQRAD
jgi:photosystem II stability/assembly factor-like uncharacterized protein